MRTGKQSAKFKLCSGVSCFFGGGSFWLHHMACEILVPQSVVLQTVTISQWILSNTHWIQNNVAEVSYKQNKFQRTFLDTYSSFIALLLGETGEPNSKRLYFLTRLHWACPWSSSGTDLDAAGFYHLFLLDEEGPRKGKPFVLYAVSVCCHVWLFATPWTVAHQAPLSLEFSRQEYWKRSHFLRQGRSS